MSQKFSGVRTILIIQKYLAIKLQNSTRILRKIPFRLWQRARPAALVAGRWLRLWLKQFTLAPALCHQSRRSRTKGRCWEKRFCVFVAEPRFVALVSGFSFGEGAHAHGAVPKRHLDPIQCVFFKKKVCLGQWNGK